MFALWTVVRFGIALVAAVVLYLIGAAIVGNFSNAEPPPDEPDVATLEYVDFRYRCIVCGAQMVMYASQGGEVPEPPRHCREPMLLMAPIDDSGTTAP
jgi:hypothetical protein